MVRASLSTRRQPLALKRNRRMAAVMGLRHSSFSSQNLCISAGPMSALVCSVVASKCQLCPSVAALDAAI